MAGVWQSFSCIDQMPLDWAERNAPVESYQPGNPFANTGDGRGSVAVARDGLTKAGIAQVEKAAETGLAENIAAPYRDDPLEAEGAVRDTVLDS